MQELENPDQEPEAVEKGKAVEALKPRKAFSKLQRELTEEELSSSAVQRLLLDDLEQLELRVEELSDFREKFYEADKQRAILEEHNKTTKALEILFAVCLTVGAALIGLTPAYENTNLSNYLLGIGVLLIIGGVASRVVRK